MRQRRNELRRHLVPKMLQRSKNGQERRTAGGGLSEGFDEFGAN
jgi:hypothetical protein